MVSDPAHTSVANGAATFSDISPGTSISATLPQVNVRDVGVEAVVTAPTTTPGGSGFYYQVALRSQTNGDTYYAKLRFLPSGGVAVGLGRISGGVDTMIGPEVAVNVSLDKPITVQAVATGSGPVNLTVRAWSADESIPDGWQVSYTDTAPGSLGGAGSVGLLPYLSRGAQAPVSVGLRRLTVWNGGIGAPYAPPTTSPSPTPTGSTPPPQPVPEPGTGSAPLGSTSYPIPSNALFVAPDGNDTAAGSMSAPLRTLANAISRAGSGTTIVLRGGTYHESVTIPANKTLTVQSYPGEVVWFDGTTPVTSWTKVGSVWVDNGWTAQFDSIPSYDPNNIPTGPDWSMVNPQYPMAAHPDEVWLDNTELAQVGSAAEVKPGTFYVDYGKQQLIIGSDPTGHAVTATDLSLAITSYGPNSVLRGFGVRRYATSVDQIGTVRLEGNGDSIENVLITDSATTGLTTDVSDTSIRNVTVLNSGMLGVHGNTADHLTISGLRAEGNNDEHFNPAPSAGGIKITRTRGIAISNSLSTNNLGTGIWLDESCYNVNVTNTDTTNNASHGLSFEISGTGILANDVVTGNAQDGFKINNADHLQIWNNLISSNGRNVEIVEDSRRGSNPNDPGHDPRQPQPDPTEPWIIEYDTLMNNVIGPPTGDAQVYGNDYSGEYGPGSLHIQLDGNEFIKPASNMIVWWGTAYNTPAAFAAATGQGGHNVQVSAGETPPANVPPLLLPADVAAAIGQPAGTQARGPIGR